MALHQHQFLQNHHSQRNQQQQISNNPFGKFYNIDGQISPTVAYLSVDQPQHPPYIPPWFAPSPVPVADVADARDEFQLGFGFEPQKKRIKEQDLLEKNNSQLSSIDFLQARPVSTGLGLSLDNNRLASPINSPFLGLLGDEIDMELQRQDAEIDRFLKIQADRLRQSVLEKLQAQQLQTLTCVEQKALQKLHEKDTELEIINKKNMDLESKLENLELELSDWQQMAKQNEDTINALKFNLQQIYAQNGDSKEGCGDSEVDDTASCCNGRALDLHLLCKVCGLNRVCMLLLPCKHLCVCKECESEVSVCPLCHSSKYMGVEVFM